MSVSLEAMEAARLAQLEGALLGLLRDVEETGADGLHVTCTVEDGQVAIDLAYMANGLPIFGKSV